MSCNHRKVMIETVEEMSQVFDTELGEWVGDPDFGECLYVQRVICEDCHEDLTREIAERWGYSLGTSSIYPQ